MKPIVSHLSSWDLNKRTVFVRADLNVPLYNHSITDAYKLEKTIPTIDFILKNGGRCIIATHLGRPSINDPAYSTAVLARWFSEQGYDTCHVPLLMHPLPENKLIILENLRFYWGETHNDPVYLEQIASCADYYVNEAFAASHGSGQSLTALPLLFCTNKRALGFECIKEIETLTTFMARQKPWAIICGGGKLQEKIPLIETLSHKHHILLGPGISNVYMQAQNKPIGRSITDNDLVEKIKNKNNPTIHLPIDYLVARNTWSGPLRISSIDDVQDNEIIISVGPKTTKKWQALLKNVEGIFFNGPMGTQERPATQTYLKEIMNNIANQTSVYRVIAGGDSVAFARHCGLEDKVNACLTAGGAALAYIAGERMPGLEPFIV